MLAWVHQAVAGEQEFLDGLFGFGEEGEELFLCLTLYVFVLSPPLHAAPVVLLTSFFYAVVATLNFLVA
jgi:hypothetical protein